MRETIGRKLLKCEKKQIDKGTNLFEVDWKRGRRGTRCSDLIKRINIQRFTSRVNIII